MKPKKGQIIYIREMLMPEVRHEYEVIEITNEKVRCQSTTNKLKLMSIPIEEYIEEYHSMKPKNTNQ